jgi:hypothetical protein
LSCLNWRFKDSPMARQGFAPCSLGERFSYFPERHTCARHRQASEEITTGRADWMAKKNKPKGEK